MCLHMPWHVKGHGIAVCKCNGRWFVFYLYTSVYIHFYVCITLFCTTNSCHYSSGDTEIIIMQ